jgi:beta-lactam-binding protein with PASTA domain
MPPESAHSEGISAVVHYVPSSEARDQVVAQSPAGGVSAPTSAQVTINVSAGAGTASVSVPSAVGMTIPQAVGAVQHAGLHLVMLRRTVSDRSQAGKVVDQSPEPAQQAPKGSRVVVYMGAFNG